MDIITPSLPQQGVAGIVDDKSQIKRRVSAISLFKKSPCLSIMAVLTILVIGAFLLTDANNNSNQILFMDNYYIYIMNENGRRIKNLISNPEYRYTAPTWSPDGKKIAFESRSRSYNSSFNGNFTGRPYISVINADGTSFIQLQEGTSPAWSPCGTKIAFKGNFHDIYIMNADGTGLTHLIDV